jgi:hypothetical protein
MIHTPVISPRISAATCGVLLSMVVAAFAYGGTGSSGMAFLKLGVSGRSVAMGDAMAASVSGAAATHFNPAGLMSRDAAENADLLFMHKEWIQDTRTEFLGARVGISDPVALGFSVNTTTVSDIELRTRPGPAEGTFTSRYLAVGVSGAYRISDAVSAGITTRFLYEEILVDDASGIGIDLGLQYATPVEGLSVGVVLANLGTMGNLRNEPSQLPTLMRAGGAFTLPVEALHGALILAADGLFMFPESRSLLNAGAELAVEGIFMARAGYQAGSEGRGLSLGGGIRHGIFALDYAFSRLNGNLGSGHTISMAVFLN